MVDDLQKCKASAAGRDPEAVHIRLSVDSFCLDVDTDLARCISSISMLQHPTMSAVLLQP